MASLDFSGIAKRIAAAGYAVYAFDYPGFGLSEGLHGYIPSFDELVDIVIEQYKKIKGVTLYVLTFCQYYCHWPFSSSFLLKPCLKSRS